MTAAARTIPYFFIIAPLHDFLFAGGKIEGALYHNVSREHMRQIVAGRGDGGMFSQGKKEGEQRRRETAFRKLLEETRVAEPPVSLMDTETPLSQGRIKKRRSE